MQSSPEPQIVTIDANSNEPTMPYGFGRRLPIIPAGLNDLNLPSSPLNILATMVVAKPTADGNDDNYSPHSTESSEPSPISTPPMNVSTFEELDTPYTTTEDDTFHSSDEPRIIYFLPSSASSPPSPPRKMKRKLEMGMSFPKEGGMSQHVCEACGKVIPPTKDSPGPSTKD